MFFHLILLTLFAVRQRPTWLIDGHNLLGSKSTPRDEATIADKLKLVQAESVFLVFDGKPNQPASSETDGIFHRIVLEYGTSADDYILDQIGRVMEGNSKSKVQVVTADRELRRRVLSNHPAAQKVVNPVVFWKRYLPRLSGLKKCTGRSNGDSNE